jgi:hypothetical protein
MGLLQNRSRCRAGRDAHYSSTLSMDTINRPPIHMHVHVFRAEKRGQKSETNQVAGCPWMRLDRLIWAILVANSRAGTDGAMGLYYGGTVTVI